MGYKGVAITDHNGCQAFPVVYGIINDYNKKIEDKSKHFKGLYGVELTLVDDTVNNLLLIGATQGTDCREQIQAIRIGCCMRNSTIFSIGAVRFIFQMF